MQLPLKYRPRKYSEIIGQTNTVRFLQALSKKQIGRNIVLYGSWGSGKTSSARIYAKAVNCLNLDIEGNPCYSCEACRDSSSVVEIDAASSSGKDDVKNLLEIAKVPPITGKYKVIIADEAQQFSKAAWDALLKSIEEPKSFQVFIFSTTEIEKVRDAIKSRCQCMEVKLLTFAESKQLLRGVCEKECFEYEDMALDILAFLSEGHPRDLLKNLEQVSFLGDISAANASLIFNLEYLPHLFSFSAGLINPQTISFRELLLGFQKSAKDVVEILRQFHLFLYYKFVNIYPDYEINPVFKLIPANDLTALWAGYEKILQKDSSGNFCNILQKLSDIKENSFSILEVEMISLHKYIHVGKFQELTSEQIVQTAPEIKPASSIKRKGRQFISLSENELKKLSSAPVENNIQEILPEVKKERNPVDLLVEYGCIKKEKPSSEIIIFEDVSP